MGDMSCNVKQSYHEAGCHQAPAEEGGNAQGKGKPATEGAQEA